MISQSRLEFLLSENVNSIEQLVKHKLLSSSDQTAHV